MRSSDTLLTALCLGAMTPCAVAGCSRATCAETQTCADSPTDAASGVKTSMDQAEESAAAAVDTGAESADEVTSAEGGRDATTESEAEPGDRDDAQAGESEAAVEAGIRANSEAGASEAGASNYCATLSPTPAFCDDFDEHPLPGEWIVDDVGGSLAEDSSSFVSPPNSLLAVYHALATGQPLDTRLRTPLSLPAPPSVIVLEFQLEPVASDPTTGDAAVVVALDFTDAATNRYTVQITLVRQQTAIGARLEEQSGFVDGGTSYSPHALADPLPPDQWTHIRLVITRSSATAASALVTFNGNTELDTPLAPTVNPSDLQLTIGSTFETEPSDGWQNRFDNVRLDFQ